MQETGFLARCASPACAYLLFTSMQRSAQFSPLRTEAPLPARTAASAVLKSATYFLRLFACFVSVLRSCPASDRSPPWPGPQLPSGLLPCSPCPALIVATIKTFHSCKATRCKLASPCFRFSSPTLRSHLSGRTYENRSQPRTPFRKEPFRRLAKMPKWRQKCKE